MQKKVGDVEKLERQSLICAILGFPLMLMAAVGLDVALVVVSLYPNVAFFIGFESVMPAYFAYRILVEVVLEALPQVHFWRTASLVSSSCTLINFRNVHPENHTGEASSLFFRNLSLLEIVSMSAARR